MSALAPSKSGLVRAEAVNRLRCQRIVVYELIHKMSDVQIAKRMGWSEVQLALFRNKNALVLEQLSERYAKLVVNRATAAKLTVRKGAADRAGRVLDAWDEVLGSDNLMAKARVAETLANRIDPIKHRVEHSVAELSQKTIEILRGHGEMGELIEGEVEVLDAVEEG